MAIELDPRLDPLHAISCRPYWQRMAGSQNAKASAATRKASQGTVMLYSIMRSHRISMTVLRQLAIEIGIKLVGKDERMSTSEGIRLRQEIEVRRSRNEFESLDT